MPYKYNTKTFEMRERHPISRARYESATRLIQRGDKAGEEDICAKARELWRAK